MKKKFVVMRRCVAQDFVFVEADHEEEAITRVQQGEGDTQHISLEFVKPLPPIEWRAEPLSNETHK